ncbi:hypothetical protein [Paraburkholderia sediminicola]|uniref:hypothetical protein n=1 Tax=Paraburkholderia sediminicola TaxID=458836 RepID=UPI0038B705AD
MWKWLQRLKEPSTHAAMATLVGVAGAVAVGQGADPHMVAQAGLVGQAVFGLLGALLPEQGQAA